jgi:hypothetical protein
MKYDIFWGNYMDIKMVSKLQKKTELQWGLVLEVHVDQFSKH